MSSVHLPSIMVLNTPYRLPEAVPPAVLVIRIVEAMLVEDHARAFRRITGAVQVPVMTGISALNRHIRVIRHNDIEICRIYLL